MVQVIRRTEPRQVQGTRESGLELAGWLQGTQKGTPLGLCGWGHTLRARVLHASRTRHPRVVLPSLHLGRALPSSCSSAGLEMCSCQLCWLPLRTAAGGRLCQGSQGHTVLPPGPEQQNRGLCPEVLADGSPLQHSGHSGYRPSASVQAGTWDSGLLGAQGRGQSHSHSKEQ